MHHPSRSFDIIGDVHGCSSELVDLLELLDAPDQSRTLVFVGDLVNRGPDPVGVLRLVMQLYAANAAMCVLGNHDDQLRWLLHGRDVEPTPELLETRAALQREPGEFRAQVR